MTRNAISTAIIGGGANLLKRLEEVLASSPDIKGFILHKGEPPGLHECSKCRDLKGSEHFKYYQSRVDKNGYLMRSNALCNSCDKTMKQERESTLKKAELNNEIGDKPQPGSICPNCKRAWGAAEQPRNWHRDHDAILNVFRGWLCGDCNMAKHDHRHGTS